MKRKHFGLPRNPFQDDVQTPDDHQTASVRYVRATLNDCANHHGFVAVVGESGAGKSTLAEDLEERIKADKRDVVVIRLYVLAMEANDQKWQDPQSPATSPRPSPLLSTLSSRSRAAPRHASARCTTCSRPAAAQADATCW